MKKLLLILVIPAFVLTGGCNRKNVEIAMLKAQNDSLISIGFVKDSTVIDFVNAFNDIQSNLDSIKMQEKIISKNVGGGGEIKTMTKDQINSDINLIYKLQQDNKAMVATLRSKLNKSGVHAVQLEKMVDNLTTQIEEKDAQIVQLKDDLEKKNVQVTDLTTKVGDLNANVDNLSTQNKLKQQVIDDKTSELNTAFYVIGTTSVLKDQKIITKEGGFIGIGRTKDLASGMDKNDFTRIDITKVTVIPIMKNKVVVLSSHPKTSYRISGKNASDSLFITNANEFWSLSKVLVLNVR